MYGEAGEESASGGASTTDQAQRGDRPEIWLYAGELNRLAGNFPVAIHSYQKALERGAQSAAFKGLGESELGSRQRRRRRSLVPARTR